MPDLPPPAPIPPAASVPLLPGDSIAAQVGSVPPGQPVPPGQEPPPSWKKPCCIGCGCFGLMFLGPIIAAVVLFAQFGMPFVHFANDVSRVAQAGKPERLYELTTPEFQASATPEDFARVAAKLEKLDWDHVSVASIDRTPTGYVVLVQARIRSGGSQPLTVWLDERDGTLRIAGIALHHVGDSEPKRAGITP